MASPRFSDIIPPPGRPTAPSKPAVDPEDAAETYHLTADQLAELNATGTTQCDEGCTITADIGAAASDTSAPDMSAGPGDGGEGA